MGTVNALLAVPPDGPSFKLVAPITDWPTHKQISRNRRGFAFGCGFFMAIGSVKRAGSIGRKFGEGFHNTYAAGNGAGEYSGSRIQCDLSRGGQKDGSSNKRNAEVYRSTIRDVGSLNDNGNTSTRAEDDIRIGQVVAFSPLLAAD